MNERREPTISPLSNAEEGDSARSRGVRQQAVETPANVRRSARPAAAQQANRTQRSGLPIMGIFAFIVAAGACAAAGFVYQQLQETQANLGNSVLSLKKAEERIATLEEKLELTGDESVQSMTVLQTNIKTNASEIKKLWGVAYDKNRTAIEENKTAIDALAKTYKSNDAKLNKSFADLSADVSVLSELMNAQQGVLANVDKVEQEQKKAMAVLAGKLSALDQSLSKRVLSNEEAIKAIDAFRVQVNRDMIRLKGG